MTTPEAFVLPATGLTVPQASPLKTIMTWSPETAAPPFVTLTVTVEVDLPSAAMLAGDTEVATELPVCGGLVVWIVSIEALCPKLASEALIVQKPVVAVAA